MRRRYSIENGVLFDINRHSVQNKIDITKSQTLHGPIKKLPTRKRVYLDQTGVINKPELKNTLEVDNIELNFKKSYKSKRSKVNETISHQSAYSFEENNFSIHSDEIDEENEEFFFERDNENNLIDVLEEKIQKDIAREERRRHKKNQSEMLFRTVKLDENNSQNEDAHVEKQEDQVYHKKYSVDNILKNSKTQQESRFHNVEDNNQIDEEQSIQNQEVEDMNEIVDNFVDMDQYDQVDNGNNTFQLHNPQNEEGSHKENENSQQFEIQSEQSKEQQNLNKSDEVRFDTVSKKLNFDVIKDRLD